jgi:hypothetical protein
MYTQQQEKGFNHAVRGLTGKEKIESSKFRTFCNLCRNRIPFGSDVLVLTANDDPQQEFFIHVDCGLAKMTQIHHAFFLEEVKMRPRPKRTKQPQKKVHQGDDLGYCNFCGRLITADEQYVKEDKKRYHKIGRGDCYSRYKKTLGRTRTSLGQ